MATQPAWCLVVVATLVFGLLLANRAYDGGWSNYASRKIGHVFAGVGLATGALVFDSSFWAVGIAGAFSAAFIALRLRAPFLLRGVGGSARPQAVAEVWYPVACTASLLLGWTWLGSPWLGVVPALFLSFGDTATGAARLLLYRREVKGWWGSLVMLAVCLALAFLVRPYWIGAAGALTATVAEKFTETRRFLDDNLTLTLSSAILICSLHHFFG